MADCMIWSINSIEAQKSATDDHKPLLWVDDGEICRVYSTPKTVVT